MEDFQDGSASPVHGDLLYHTVVSLDEDCKAFLLLLTDRISFVALNLRQSNRVRNYSWTYKQIKKVVKADVVGEYLLYLYIEDQPGLCDSFQVIFVGVSERDSYATRINSLINLYRRNLKTSPDVSQQDSCNTKPVVDPRQLDRGLDRSEEEEEEAAALNDRVDNCQVTQPRFDTPPKTPKSSANEFKLAETSVGLNMFSPENLRRIAKTSSQESITDSLPGLIETPRGEPPLPSCDAIAHLDKHGNLIIPIDISVSGSDGTGLRLANMNLAMKINVEAINEAKLILDKAQRIAKMREIVQMEMDKCEIVLN